MRLGLIALTVLSIFVIVTKAVEESRFSMEELEELMSKKDWAEAVKRLDEIPSAERTSKWETVVERAAVGYFKQISETDRGNADLMGADLEKKYPSLKRSKSFRALRHDNAIQGFADCYKNPEDADECTKRLVDFVKADKMDTEFAFKSAKLVTTKYKPEFGFAIFQYALTSANKGVICADADMKKALIAALNSTTVEVREEAKKTASDPCWKYFQADLEKEFDRVPSGDFVSNTCSILKSKGKLTPTRSQKCE